MMQHVDVVVSGPGGDSGGLKFPYLCAASFNGDFFFFTSFLKASWSRNVCVWRGITHLIKLFYVCCLSALAERHLVQFSETLATLLIMHGSFNANMSCLFKTEVLVQADFSPSKALQICRFLLLLGSIVAMEKRVKMIFLWSAANLVVQT